MQQRIVEADLHDKEHLHGKLLLRHIFQLVAHGVTVETDKVGIHVVFVFGEFNIACHMGYALYTDPAAAVLVQQHVATEVVAVFVKDTVE